MFEAVHDNVLNRSGGRQSPVLEVHSVRPNFSFVAFKDCADCPEMMIPGGEFKMGSPGSEVGRERYEDPQHPVRIHKSCVIGKYEVTRKEYAEFRNQQHIPDDLDHCFVWDESAHWWQIDPAQDRNWRKPFPVTQTERDPATCVSREAAERYVRWLSNKTNKNYRLPTEAEWEYAARSGERGHCLDLERHAHDLLTYVVLLMEQITRT